MDCEKFDRVALDLLYDELDELTSAAAKRHLEHCARCRRISSSLRAIRSVGSLKLVDPPDGLELKILEAERQAHAGLPARQRLGRAISIMASYAMRPQLAMAALLVLMIGSSLFFLRARPGGHGNVLVTERGVPETAETEAVAIVPTPERPPISDTRRSQQAHGALAAEGEKEQRRAKGEAPEATAEAPAADGPVALGGRQALRDPAAFDAGEIPSLDSDYDAAMSAYRDGRYVEAQSRFENIASRGGSKAAQAALYAAQSVRNKSGCPAAAPLFFEVHSRYRGSSAGSDAGWQAGECYQQLGELDRARQSYEALLQDSAYGDRAQAALGDLREREQRQVAARAAAKPASATKAKAKASSRPAEAAPQKAAPQPQQPRNSLGF